MFIEKHLENGNYSDQLLWYTQMYLMLSVCGPCTMKPDLSWIKCFHSAVQKKLKWNSLYKMMGVKNAFNKFVSLILGKISV